MHGHLLMAADLTTARGTLTTRNAAARTAAATRRYCWPWDTPGSAAMPRSGSAGKTMAGADHEFY